MANAQSRLTSITDTVIVGAVNGGIKLVALICIACYVVLRWMVWRVWYKKEFLRPSYFRHTSIISTADFLSWVFLTAAFFLMLNLGHWVRIVLITAVLVGYDYCLRRLFLYLEARRICRQQPGWSIGSAKRRVLQRIERETL